MPVLTLVNVQHAFGTRAILDGATLSIEPGEKVGLVGRNGSGKTTLMKVMTGQLKADSGTVALQRGARIGYLSQDPNLDPDDTVRDAAERAYAELHELHVQLHHVYEQMATAEGEELERLMRQQTKLESGIEAAGHVGRKDIVAFLLEKGSRTNIFLLTMLGQTTWMKSYLELYPSHLFMKGPHGFSLLHHANKGGEEAGELAAYLQQLGLKETRFNLYS